MVEYRYASINDLATALRSGATSPVELAHEAVTLLGELGPRYNAVASLLPARAEREAAAAASQLAAGDPAPLCGIPYGVKDLFAARGGPTTWGSTVFASRVIGRDATVIARLAKHGSILVGKLTMSELAGGGRPAAPGASMHGQGRNPWNLDHYSGGSSSGPGIAVAAGLLPFSLGTETGGSVLGPAAFSGVTGIRPTHGLVPRGGVMTLSWSLDKVGVLTRSARDAATVLRAITRPRPTKWDALRSTLAGPDELDVSNVRVAMADTELAEASPAIRRALQTGLAELTDIVGQVTPFDFPRNARFVDALEEIVQVEGAFEFRELLRDPAFVMSDDQQQARLRHALGIPAVDYLESLRVAARVARSELLQIFKRADVIVAASRPDVAPLLDQARAPRDPTKLSELLRVTGNLAGVPGVSFPCGFADNGMPVGLQLVGPPNSDWLLLAVAAAYQQATTHHLAQPPDLQPTTAMAPAAAANPLAVVE